MAGSGPARTVGGVTARRYAIFVLLGLIAVAAVLPLFWLRDKADKVTADPAFSALATYARSLNGDRTADAEAARVLPLFTRADTGAGRYRLGFQGTGACWVLDVVGDEPAQAPRQADPGECRRP